MNPRLKQTGIHYLRETEVGYSIIKTVFATDQNG